MAGDDDDKTVFGQPLPGAGGPSAPRPVQPRPPAGSQPVPPAGTQGGGAGSSGERTVFGQPMPPAPGGQAGARVAPGGAQLPPASGYPQPGYQQSGYPQGGGAQDPWNNPGADDTWLGGALAPQNQMPQNQAPQGYPAQGYPAQGHPPYPGQSAPSQVPGGYPQPQPSFGQPSYGQPSYGQPAADDWAQPRPQAQPAQPYRAAQPIYQPGTGQAAPGSQIFPDLPQPETRPQYAARQKIALADALRGTPEDVGGSSNPLIRAASNLLILLGRLRTGLVEMQAGPLIDHVTREIDLFERRALEAGLPQADVGDAKYALSATADDIVQNLPGADRGLWIQYSMVARFFGERASGVGFFQKMDDAMKAPAQRYTLLELMLTCLSLGFEGQYRATQNGSVELARIRTAIYETLRRVQARHDDDVSVHWTPVPMSGRRMRGGTPVWVVAAVASVMVVALFATLSTLLTRQGAQVRDGILALHAGQPPITIERSEPVVEAYVAPETTQLERIRAGLSDQIASGAVEVDRKNDWVFVRVGDALQFASGSAELTNDFSALAQAIGVVMNGEQGPVRVVGHSDSTPMSGRGRYKTNQQLSEARAQTVADLLGETLEDTGRLAVEGMGAVDPIADNATAEGRARNRRVEIMIERED